MEILTLLSIKKRGYSIKSKLVEIENAILNRQKTGIQWEVISVKSIFSEVILSYKSVFSLFSKCCKNEDCTDSGFDSEIFRGSGLK